MEEEYISVKTAKLAYKIDGYNKDFKWEDKYYVMPDGNEWDYPRYSAHQLHTESKVIPKITQSLLQKWLREKYNIQLYIPFFILGDKITYGYFIGDGSNNKDIFKNLSSNEHVTYKTYEEGLEKGLQEALKLIKEEK